MRHSEPHFKARLATTPEELRAAQTLRYEVFIEELGGDGVMVDHHARLEQDRFDPYFDHLILSDERRGGKIIGVYRLLREDQARRAGQFYSEDEYDLTPLKCSGRKLLELGRSCVAREYRGGTAMFHLWQALAQYVQRHEIDIMFGVASFHGTDAQALAQPLSLLHYRHLAPKELRVRACAEQYQPLDLIEESQLDRVEAMRRIPPLIKAYLRLGGYVGDGAFIDHKFNTLDICLIMDTSAMNNKLKSFYSRGVSA
ncbi:Mlr3216 protein [hydrothermal vent metagenome]|uniref:Mlr3216 protein n=1 Tax=hydrothermal vent metagenome TaxID=652676 RepID=A0A3B0RD69_9ZZZZ